ncbi:MAG: YndJ family protein [Myxococcales bacterium]|nr:YndJ family protein [Myxococcales bacterium]
MGSPPDIAPPRQALRVALRRSAGAGLLLWLLLLAPLVPAIAAATIDPLPLLPRLVLLGPLVVVPLGLALALGDALTPAAELDRARAAIVATLVRAQLPAAALAAVAFHLPTGWLAAGLAAPWLLVAGLISLLGLLRFHARRHELRAWAGVRASLDRSAVDIGLVYLAVGGAWLLAANLGMQPLGFHEPLVTLTASHFHFAGFAAPVITGLTGHALARRGAGPGARRLFRAAAILVIPGPIIVAIGITASPLVEVISACVLAAALAGVALLLVFALAPATRPRLAGALLAIAGLSVLVTMALACLYAWGEYSGLAHIEIPQMIELHGTSNALGFAALGLLGFSLADDA